MGKLKEHGSGDAPTNHFTTILLGRFRITHCTPGVVWMTDYETGESGSFDEKKMEAALLKFFSEEF
jgi:hypothetical protein